MAGVCSNCGAQIQPEAPFCPGCGAPQIRVAPQPQAGEILPPPPSPGAPGAGPQPPVDWNFARSRSLAAAALLAALLLLPPTARLFLLWMPLCGALAVYLYRSRRPRTLIPAAAGARMGVMTGLMAFAICVGVLAVSLVVEHYALHQDVAQMAHLRAQVQQAVNANPDPQARKFGQALLTPNGLAMLVVLTAILFLFLFLLLGGLGGALGAAWLKRRRRP